MRHTITLALVLSCFVSFAQRPTATAEQVEAFFSTTTYVIQRDDLMNGYNAFMKKAFEENWKLTSFEFITHEQFQEKRKDPKASFVLLTETSFSNDPTPARYSFVSVVLGGDYPSINDMPEICAFPLLYTESDDIEVMTFLPAIMNFITNHITNIKQNPKLLRDKKYSFYTKQKKAIANKTLYIVTENQLPAFQTLEGISTIYPGNVRFVEYEDIAAAIAEKNAQIVFHLKVASEKAIEGTRCYTIIMGTDGTLYYFNFHRVKNTESTNGILAKEWKQFKKFVK